MEGIAGWRYSVDVKGAAKKKIRPIEGSEGKEEVGEPDDLRPLHDFSGEKYGGILGRAQGGGTKHRL